MKPRPFEVFELRPFPTAAQLATGGVALLGMLLNGALAVALSLKGTQGPLSPDAAHGFVIPFYDHAIVHYETRELSSLQTIVFSLQGLFSVVVALTVLHYLFVTRWRVVLKQPSRKPPQPAGSHNETNLPG